MKFIFVNHYFHLDISATSQLLTDPAEMTVLVGGVRVLKTSFGQSQHGVFTARPEAIVKSGV